MCYTATVLLHIVLLIGTSCFALECNTRRIRFDNILQYVWSWSHLHPQLVAARGMSQQSSFTGFVLRDMGPCSDIYNCQKRSRLLLATMLQRNASVLPAHGLAMHNGNPDSLTQASSAKTCER